MVKRRNKASLSNSPLARPETLIHTLAGEIQNYLYFPDPSALYVTLGTVAANMLTGNPVWLILVGPPGCGKTLILEMFADMPYTKIVSVIKGPSVLLSGTARKEIGKGATGGLLREIGLVGMLIMTDMAGMLKLPADPLGETLSAFRDIYGGRWVRPVGSEGGRSLVWGPDGKLTFLAASTPAIDRHHVLNAELGERWIYYRFPESDGHGETQAALRNKDPQEAMRDLRSHISNFFSALELDLKELKRARDFTPREEMRIEAMANISVRMRSDVPRDGYTKEIIDIADPERPQRLATVLGQLYLGLETIGLGPKESWEIAGKAAMDSAPRLRSAVVSAASSASSNGETGVTMAALVTAMQCSQKTVERTVQDLVVHHVVEKRKGNGSGSKGDVLMVGLTDWAKEQMKRGWGL